MKRAIFSNEKLLDKLINNNYLLPIKAEEKLIAKVEVKHLHVPTLPASIANASKSQAQMPQPIAIKIMAPTKIIEEQEPKKMQQDKNQSEKLIFLKSVAANLIDLGIVGVIDDEQSVILSALSIKDIEDILLFMEQRNSFSCETPYGMVEFCRLVYKAANKKEMSDILEEALLIKYKRASSLEYLHEFLSEVTEEIAALLSKKNISLELILAEVIDAGDQELANELLDILGGS